MGDFPIPEDALANHIAALGKTGSGKTSTTKTIVERVVAQGFRVCVLDPIKSDWWGLTSNANGTAPGLPFKILGGPHGHVPLPASAGAAVGRLVGAGELPLSIIDMADFRPGGLQQFFIPFAEALLKNIRGVVYLVMEEAHEFAPKERANMGDENLSIYWAKKLATAGRSMGVRLIVATQRTQALHNALLGSCETLIAHRLTFPADQKPVLDWLKANAGKATATQIAGELSSLPTGTAWVCAGESQVFEKIAFPKFQTFDNAATPLSDDDAPEVATAPVDAAALRDILGEAVAEAEANDPKRLRAEIARLEKELRAAAKGQASAAADPAALRQATLDGIAEGERRGRLAGIALGITRAQEALKGLRVDDPMFSSAASNEEGKMNMAPAPGKPARAATPSPRPPRPIADGQVSTGARRWLEGARDIMPMTLPWSSLAALIGRKASGGQFNSIRKELVEGGYVAADGGAVTLTPKGLDAVGGSPANDTPVLDRLLKALPTSAANILRALHEMGGVASPADIGELLGRATHGGQWNAAVSILRAGGVIEGRETFRLADWVVN